MQEPADATGPGLAWGVKASFVRYVTMGGGEVRVSPAAASVDGLVFFPLLDQGDFELATARGTLRFGGSVRFTGHFGALDLMLAEPWLESDERGAVVSVDTGATGRVPLVALGPAETGVEGELIVWRDIETRMLPEAGPLFNGVYGAGEPFDPATLRIRDL
ncbi:HtaA domain-containing protein [Salinibacterium sp. SYSU T00001]|uniref:HtaA domain-containing protein n=1 Tax=Homoserinimonas sedimenticola TaxID=2986805 RepID=UPI00223630AC|nr:HtaA domain-containing protein [Salinibacterium sedimenticola]MCW4385422.1 HtaA domain-containing protein [Salinibacterium sedimenticola]